MSLSPIGSAVFELLSRKHTYRHTDIHHITLEYRYTHTRLTFFYPYYKVIGCLSVCLYVCLSVCLWLNNSKTAEPIGLKLIECLLLGPRMVLG